MNPDELITALVRSTAQQALTQTRNTSEEAGVKLFAQLLIDKLTIGGHHVEGQDHQETRG